VSWPPEQRHLGPETSWTLQVQYEPDGWWSNHTANLIRRADADALKAERQAANPKLRYRLVRVTTTHTLERP
jgi:hypothetical protein